MCLSIQNTSQGQKPVSSWHFQSILTACHIAPKQLLAFPQPCRGLGRLMICLPENLSYIKINNA